MRSDTGIPPHALPNVPKCRPHIVEGDATIYTKKTVFHDVLKGVGGTKKAKKNQVVHTTCYVPPLWYVTILVLATSRTSPSYLVLYGVHARFPSVVSFASSPGLRRCSSWGIGYRTEVHDNLLIPRPVAPLKGSSAGRRQVGAAPRSGYGCLQDEAKAIIEGLRR